jgi:hypothetical protein
MQLCKILAIWRRQMAVYLQKMIQHGQNDEHRQDKARFTKLLHMRPFSQNSTIVFLLQSCQIELASCRF